MLPTQTQRKLPGSLLSTRHISEKFCSVSHTAWWMLYCLLTIINQDGQILAISALISSAGTLQSISNARPMKGEPGLINQLPSCHWYWMSHKPLRFTLYFHKKKVFPKRFKHSFQGMAKSSHKCGTVHQLLCYLHGWLHAHCLSTGLGWWSCFPKVLWLSLCHHK